MHKKTTLSRTLAIQRDIWYAVVCSSALRECCESPPAKVRRSAHITATSNNRWEIYCEKTAFGELQIFYEFLRLIFPKYSLTPYSGLPGAFKSSPLFLSLHHLRPCLPKKRRRRPSLHRRKSLRTRQAFAPIIRLDCFTDTLLPDLWHEERELSLSGPPLHLILAPIASILPRPGILMEE